MKKTIKAHEEKEGKVKAKKLENAIPTYLLDREEINRSKILSNTIKQKRKEKGGKWSVPIPIVKPMTEDEMFQIKYSGKRRRKCWKRIINKICFDCRFQIIWLFYYNYFLIYFVFLNFLNLILLPQFHFISSCISLSSYLLPINLFASYIIFDIF